MIFYFEKKEKVIMGISEEDSAILFAVDPFNETFLVGTGKVYMSFLDELRIANLVSAKDRH